MLPLCARGRETALPCYCNLHLTTTTATNWCVTRTPVHIHKHVPALQTLQSSSEYRGGQKLRASKVKYAFGICLWCGVVAPNRKESKSRVASAASWNMGKTQQRTQCCLAQDQLSHSPGTPGVASVLGPKGTAEIDPSQHQGPVYQGTRNLGCNLG